MLKTFILAVWGASSLSYAATLPYHLAEGAAKAALAECEKAGYHVTVTVVDESGLTQVVLKGDNALPHTLDTSRGKAYTAVTFGPLFGEDLTSKISEKIRSRLESAPLGQVPGIMLLAGGSVIKSGGEVIAGVGVGGAPGGNLDESCAVKGVAVIKGKLAE